ncbi:MAG: glycosyltransferase family 1 protein [Candidatus Komeilibacteria bacterium]|nr:glycosyltransferase family 1 protein [Candidatus Komeilibacteria bacterium]
MRIGIDARFYGTKQRGIGRYVKKLVDGLVEFDRKNDYVIFLSRDNIEDFKTTNPRVKKVLFDIRWYSLAEQLAGHKIIRRERLDLMHWPHLNVPWFAAKPYVLTIHDLIINRFPDSRASSLPKWLYWLKLLAYRQVVKRAVKRAVKIIVPSNFVKEDLLKIYTLSSEKVQVIYEGYFLADGQQTMAITHFKITKPFLLYVGSAYPHKNLERLLSVFNKLNQEKKYQLVLAGRTDYFFERLKKIAKPNPDVIFTGFVSDSELAALYHEASLYVFPSLYEGFGLPPIEAQAHGLAVVSSNTSCLPEVLADGAIYFNPNSEAEILASIKSVLENPRLRKDLAVKGSVNVKKFNWIKAVKETHSLYLSLFP